MNAHNALALLQQRIDALKIPLSRVDPHIGLELMLSFYREVRFTGCLLEEQGDMLLYQWGTYDWGTGSSFELNFTRQLILSNGEDDDIWQLSFTFRYELSQSTNSLAAGDKWCESPEYVEEFENFIRESTPFKTSKKLKPAKVELDYYCAG